MRAPALDMGIQGVKPAPRYDRSVVQIKVRIIINNVSPVLMQVGLLDAPVLLSAYLGQRRRCRFGFFGRHRQF